MVSTPPEERRGCHNRIKNVKRDKREHVHVSFIEGVLVRTHTFERPE